MFFSWDLFTRYSTRSLFAYYNLCMQTRWISVSLPVKNSFTAFQVAEDLNYVAILQKKFTHLLRIPGVLLPHLSLSSSTIPSKMNHGSDDSLSNTCALRAAYSPLTAINFYDHTNQPMFITPSMSSLEALLSKLPSVVPTPSGHLETASRLLSTQKPLELDIKVMAMELNERKEIQ